jgi:predicted TIM-barrel enzyme
LNLLSKRLLVFSLGVEFLIHDPQASLAVAKTANFSFIRTDYFVDRMARQEYGGEIKVNPKEVISYREKNFCFRHFYLC